MKGWQKGALITLVFALIAGIYLFVVFMSRKDPGVVGKKADEFKPTTDQLAVVRMKYLTNFADTKDALEGKPVWIKAGYVLPYFDYSGSTVDWTKREGEIPSAVKVNILKIIKAVVPAKVDDRVAHGIRQYLAVFNLEGSDKQYAAAIGATDGPNETILCDELFYYDPPQKIYDNWPKPVWDAVASHTPTLKMSENQVMMTVGKKIETGSTDEGNRTVTYHAGSKTWIVTFVKDQATEVKPG